MDVTQKSVTEWKISIFDLKITEVDLGLQTTKFKKVSNISSDINQIHLSIQEMMMMMVWHFTSLSTLFKSYPDDFVCVEVLRPS